MNFFAHACVALWRSDDPRFVLGSMLPDLSAMLGLRLAAVSDAALAAGIELHYETDALFHAAPAFVALCSRGVASLGQAGVGRGTARAVAHVGTELLLDGALSRDAAARETYGQVLERLRPDELGAALGAGNAAVSGELSQGLAHLARAPIPEGYRDPEFVLARLQVILTRRPRLAMCDSDRASVRAFLLAAHADMEQTARALMAHVRAGLA